MSATATDADVPVEHPAGMCRGDAYLQPEVFGYDGVVDDGLEEEMPIRSLSRLDSRRDRRSSPRRG